MDEHPQFLDTTAVSFDTENPRIRMALAKYGGHLNAERIHFALRSADENGRGTSSYVGLRDSILASGGVVSPIIVTRHDDGYRCIDGNTRLAIYKEFLRREVSGDWSKIKATVVDNANPRDIDTIRISAHLVGAREWPAYEKARYLHHLRNEKLMDYNEMIALCGGNKADIERKIDAYHDMNEYYRDIVDDTAFHIDRFSGFEELQKPRIKDAIFEAELELKDFGEWIRDGKIYRLADVRQLPRVLADKEAKQVFLEGGPRSIEQATKILDQRLDQGKAKRNTTLASATFMQVAEVLAQRIDELPYSQVRELRETPEHISALEDLSARLSTLMEDVTE